MSKFTIEVRDFRCFVPAKESDDNNLSQFGNNEDKVQGEYQHADIDVKANEKKQDKIEEENIKLMTKEEINGLLNKLEIKGEGIKEEEIQYVDKSDSSFIEPPKGEAHYILFEKPLVTFEKLFDEQVQRELREIKRKEKIERIDALFIEEKKEQTKISKIANFIKGGGGEVTKVNLEDKKKEIIQERKKLKVEYHSPSDTISYQKMQNLEIKIKFNQDISNEQIQNKPFIQPNPNANKKQNDGNGDKGEWIIDEYYLIFIHGEFCGSQPYSVTLPIDLFANSTLEKEYKFEFVTPILNLLESIHCTHFYPNIIFAVCFTEPIHPQTILGALQCRIGNNQRNNAFKVVDSDAFFKSEQPESEIGLSENFREDNSLFITPIQSLPYAESISLSLKAGIPSIVGSKSTRTEIPLFNGTTIHPFAISNQPTRECFSFSFSQPLYVHADENLHFSKQITITPNLSGHWEYYSESSCLYFRTAYHILPPSSFYEIRFQKGFKSYYGDKLEKDYIFACSTNTINIKLMDPSFPSPTPKLTLEFSQNIDPLQVLKNINFCTPTKDPKVNHFYCTSILLEHEVIDYGEQNGDGNGNENNQMLDVNSNNHSYSKNRVTFTSSALLLYESNYVLHVGPSFNSLDGPAKTEFNQLFPFRTCKKLTFSLKCDASLLKFKSSHIIDIKRFPVDIDPPIENLAWSQYPTFGDYTFCLPLNQLNRSTNYRFTIPCTSITEFNDHLQEPMIIIHKTPCNELVDHLPYTNASSVSTFPLIVLHVTQPIHDIQQLLPFINCYASGNKNQKYQFDFIPANEVAALKGEHAIHPAPIYVGASSIYLLPKGRFPSKSTIIFELLKIPSSEGPLLGESVKFKFKTSPQLSVKNISYTNHSIQIEFSQVLALDFDQFLPVQSGDDWQPVIEPKPIPMENQMGGAPSHWIVSQKKLILENIQLLSSTRYQITVPTTLLSTRFMNLSQPYHFQFTTNLVEIVSISPINELLPLIPVFYIQFNQAVPMNDSILPFIELRSKSKQYQLLLLDDIPENIIKSGTTRNCYLSFKPKQKLSLNSNIQLKILPGIPAVEGSELSVKSYQYNLRTCGKFQCTYNTITIQQKQSIQIQFSLELENYKQFSDDLLPVITPSIPGRWEVSANTLVFTPNIPWILSSKYEIKVNKNIKSSSGDRLGNTVRYYYETPLPTLSLSFPVLPPSSFTSNPCISPYQVFSILSDQALEEKSLLDHIQIQSKAGILSKSIIIRARLASKEEFDVFYSQYMQHTGNGNHNDDNI